jgi:acetyl-CoA decarbonylase/synthase complex subunit delta
MDPIADVAGDPGAWAKKCVEQFGAEAIVIQLKSTDPNGLDASPEKASEAVGKVLAAVNVPVVVWGSANSNKDAESLKRIAEDFQGKNLLLGPVDEDNYKAVGAAALAYNQSIITSSPIDVNLAKQLNILLGNLGVPMNRMVIDPTTGGLGYGLEYSYSVMERIRIAALVQEDDKLVLPMINNVGNEVWKSKEAKLGNEDAPDLGDSSMRGVLMEATAAATFLLAGSDILILRHPKSLALVKGFMEKMAAAPRVAAAKVKVDRPKAAPVVGAAKAAAPVAPAVDPAIVAKAKAAAPVAPAVDPAIVAKAKAAAPVAPAVDPAIVAKAKAAAPVAPAVDSAIVAKVKAAAEATAKAAIEAKAREAKKATEMAELAALRAKRAEERAAHAKAFCAPTRKEGVEFGKGRESGSAGPDALYIYRSIDRWKSHLSGIIK